MSPEIQILSHAREIISDPKRWTRRNAARDKSGHPVEPWEESAVCWCALGAVNRAAIDCDAKAGSKLVAEDLLYQAANDQSVADINDTEGHAAVLDLFDKALASEDQS